MTGIVNSSRKGSNFRNQNNGNFFAHKGNKPNQSNITLSCVNSTINNATNLINANPTKLDDFYKAYNKKIRPVPQQNTSKAFISKFENIKKSETQLYNSFLSSPNSKPSSHKIKYSTNEK